MMRPICFMRSFFAPSQITAIRDANIYVPHISILQRLCGTAKTPLKHVTQSSLPRRIQDLAGINIIFKVGHLSVILDTAQGLATRVSPSHPGAHR